MKRAEPTMTNEQSNKLDLLNRIDELDQLKNITSDPDTLKAIEERKKVLRTALSKLLNT